MNEPIPGGPKPVLYCLAFFLTAGVAGAVERKTPRLETCRAGHSYAPSLRSLTEDQMLWLADRWTRSEAGKQALERLAFKESTYRVRIVSSAGARGLYQLMPYNFRKFAGRKAERNCYHCQTLAALAYGKDRHGSVVQGWEQWTPGRGW